MVDTVFLTRRDPLSHIELLDDHRVDDSTRVMALQDVARANLYFGGTRVVLREFRAAAGDRTWDSMTVLDVGTGSGQVAACLREAGVQQGAKAQLFGIDLSPVLARVANASGTPTVCGNGLRLPFRDRSVDIILCCQLLHHFVDRDAVRLLRELDRVARHRVIVCDLRRSWAAVAGFWLTSHPLGFHPVARHDGVASVKRGFTGAELTRLVHDAVGVGAVARSSLGFRLSISWAPRAPKRRSFGWLGF
jgi:SAM-dependent methyltransferase